MLQHHYKIIGREKVDIIVEMGLGAVISEWLPLADRIGKQHGILLYERAGINKSAPSQASRTPENIADELFHLLESIPHEEKLFLIGHSQGGIYVNQFCRKYPQLVKGILLLDPLSADDNRFKEELTEKEYKKSGVDKTASFQIMYKLAKLKLGFLSKAMLKKAPPIYYYDKFSQDDLDDILGCACNPIHAKTALLEYLEAHQNVDNLKGKLNFPDVPLILITHDSEKAIEENMYFGNNSREFATKIEDMWQSIMKEYLTFSTQSEYVNASNSTHYIHLTEPELVANAVETLSNLPYHNV